MMNANDLIKELSKINEEFIEVPQKNEDFKNPKTHDEIKPGEWYEVEGTLYQIADRQPIKNEIQAFRVLSDYSVGKGVHVLYKSFYKPDKFKFVGKKNKITKMIKEKEAQIAKLKQEIDTLKTGLQQITESTQKNEERVKLVVEQTYPSKVIDTKIFSSWADLLKYKHKYKKDYDAGKVAFTTYAVESKAQTNEATYSENIIDDEFQKGDDVKVFGRLGKVVKVRGDVLDIEFPADDQNMARSDSYYKQEVQKV